MPINFLHQQSSETKQTKLLDSLGATDTDKYNILVERILAGESLSTEEQKQGLELEMKLYGFDSGTFATQNSGTFIGYAVHNLYYLRRNLYYEHIST